MRLTATLAGDPTLVTHTSTEVTCEPASLVTPLTMRFTTDDGQFDATWSESLALTELGDSVYLGADVPADDVGGTFPLPDTAELSLPVNYQETTFSGELIVVDTGGDGTVGECGLGAWNAPLQTGC
jgi:hypothetical protein